MLKLLQLANTTPSFGTTNYFYEQATNLTMAAGSNYSFTQSNWSTHTGGAATFATVTNYELNVNGQLQPSGIYTVGGGKLVIHNTTASAQVIPATTPLTLQAGTITPTSVVIP